MRSISPLEHDSLPPDPSQTEHPAETLPPPALSGGDAGFGLHLSQLGRFTILQQLGVGGMGSVFAAYDPQLDRKVALKVLHPQSGGRRQLLDWTLREARALARVTHPHVVAVHDVAEVGDQVYLAMEFVDGMTLRRWQSCGPRSWRDVLRMYILAGEGLLAAHQAGVIHRDFKPDNVLVNQAGMPKVADFGIARLHRATAASSHGRSENAVAQPAVGMVEPTESMASALLVPRGRPEGTDGGQGAGTLGYMSPEQRSGGVLSAASDQWSFCAALHEALHGCLPETPARTRSSTEPKERGHAGDGHSRATPMGIPPGLQVILARGLSRDPSQRFESMAQLLAALWSEHDQSPFAARHAASATVVVLSSLAFLLWLVVQYIAAKRARIIEVGVGISWLMSMSTLLVGYRFHMTLRINPFHRWVWTLMLTNFVQVLCLRLVCTFLIHIPFRAAHLLEMAVWGGTLSILGTQLIRPLRWAVLIPILSGTVCALMESPPRRLLLLSYPIMCGLVLWMWRQASHNKVAVLSESTRGTIRGD